MNTNDPFPINTGYKPPKQDTAGAAPHLGGVAPVAAPSRYITDIEAIPVFMQSLIPDCVENAITFVKRYYEWKSTGQLPDLSRRFLAILTVQKDGFPLVDGTSVANALDLAKNTGICSGALLTDDHTLTIEQFSAAPILPAMVTDAGKHKIARWTEVADKSAQGLKDAIYQNGVVVVGAQIDKNWWTDVNGNNSWAASAILPIRPPTDPVTKSGHAFVLYGYDEKYFYFRNSFGPTWGDNGNGCFSVNELPYIYEAATLVDAEPVPQNIQQANQIVNTIDSLQKVETPQNKGIINSIIATLWKLFLSLFNPQG